MFGRLLTVFGFAVLLFGEECIYVAEVYYGKLNILATDVTGGRIEPVSIELTSVENPQFKVKIESSGTIVPYGNYHLRVSARGFGGQSRYIRVYRPETLIRMDLHLPMVCGRPMVAEINGRVDRGNETGELWVKAVSVRGISGGEARVSELGHFLISGLEESTYVVMILKGEAVLHQEIVKTEPHSRKPTTLSINLARSRPAPPAKTTETADLPQRISRELCVTCSKSSRRSLPAQIRIACYPAGQPWLEAAISMNRN